VPVNRRRHRNTVRLSESLDPHAARIVDMASEHPNRAPRRTRDSIVPQCSGELLDQEGCDAVVRGPSLQNAAMQWRSPRLHGSPPNVLRLNDPAHRPVVVQLSRLLLRLRPFQSSARQADEPGNRRGYRHLVRRGSIRGCRTTMFERRCGPAAADSHDRWQRSQAVLARVGPTTRMSQA
jgi:hypothetical protein